ncbi:MAG: threonylcarbamoyl-AMP synthase [Bacteroidetes bacterium GWE2_29_8]|nr:MAG: threonylcarbamoyl-AMP synthase [Bacteroidetes bacterium GWE2_29_8]OFY21703.1 MAG: threonylcarbamoyl-AMP synthase [Bacteroidetes bacterium GWF2_29_10]
MINNKELINKLKEGQVILYPAETIWGIGCDATNEEAVNKLIKIKYRNAFKGFIVLVDRFSQIYNYVVDVPEIAESLVEYADSPLTIIYPKGRNLASNVCNEDGSIAIRVVKEGFPFEFLKTFGKPLVSTSANISGEVSPKTFKEINPQIIKSVDYIVDLPNIILKSKESSILKLNINGEFKFIRQ